MSKIDYVFSKFRQNIYNKSTETNLYKILNEISKTFDDFINNLEEVKNSKYVNFAKGSDLDRIGELINIQRYYNENDVSFRGRIKSAIPSFIGGGTVSSIIQVIQSFLGVTPVVIEHYRPGNSHAVFYDGILNGFNIYVKDDKIVVNSGVAYVQGNRIYIPSKTEANLLSSSIKNYYVYLDLNTNEVVFALSLPTSNYIDIGRFISENNQYHSLNDMREILNPFDTAITNVASITVQIPYNFTETLIGVEEVKSILLKTRAAGVALLINVVGEYSESIDINDKIDFGFLMGVSYFGSKNFIGGY